jgi:hypothetical protein
MSMSTGKATEGEGLPEGWKIKLKSLINFTKECRGPGGGGEGIGGEKDLKLSTKFLSIRVTTVKT